MNSIVVSNVTKKYGKVLALNDVSLQINKGEIFALLGLNGAGKTTLIKILCGLIHQNKGEVEVFGFNNTTDLQKIKSITGISPQDNAIASNLTVKENLLLMARLYGKSKFESIEESKRMINKFLLTEYQNTLAKNLSGGYKRRLSLAMAIITSPSILFLDEPTLGLDIISRNALWSIINELKNDMSIVLTTHYLEEAEHLAQRIALMKKGKIELIGTRDEILKETNTSSFEEAFIKVMGEL